MLSPKLLAGLMATSTMQEYQKDWEKFMAACDNTPTPECFAAWRQDMADRQELSAATINRRITAVRAVVAEAYTRGLIDEPTKWSYFRVRPVSPLALKHRKRKNNKTALTPDQVRALIDAPDPATLRGLRDRALLATYATSAGRNEEIATLTMEQIHPAGQEYVISLLGKEDEEPRLAPLAREAYQRILEWMARRTIESPYIFLAFDGRGDARLSARPMTIASVWRTVRKYAEEAGIPHLKPHDLRRYVVTQVADKAGLSAAQKVAGHASVRTTAGYITAEMQPGITNDLI